VAGGAVSATHARLLALKVVSRVREREAYAHETLDAVLRKDHAVHRDAAFATRLAYGTIACRGTLDEAVARFVTRPDSLEPAVADALAVSAYELLFARTPPHVAVSEGVELVRSVQARAAGFANAVLRRLAEAADEFPWGDPDHDDEALARSVGHPIWLTRLWIDELGREAAAAVMRANNEPAPLFLAHLPFKATFDETMVSLERDGVEPVRGVVPGCIVAGVPSAAVRSHALRDHQVVVVDEGAQFAALAAAPQSATHIVEFGAGRGSKTFIMAGEAARSGGHVLVTAVDTHDFKLTALTDTVKALHIDGITAVRADATSPAIAPLLPSAPVDRVLVDAPCSGLGTLRRHPDRRWRAQPSEIEALAALGGRLLESAASLVTPGGFVVYSTCTIARAENAEVIEGFLTSEAGRGFAIDSLMPDVPEPWSGYVGRQGYFQSLPEVGGMDGHFVARLLRERTV